MIFSLLPGSYDGFRWGWPSAKAWPVGFVLFRGSWSRRFLFRCFTALAEQRQGILGAKGETANGLFTSGAQGDVDAPVIGQPHGQQVFQDLLLFRRAHVRFGFYQFLYLFRGQVLFKAERPSLKVFRGHAFFNQVALGAFHAPLGELHIVVLSPANIRVAFENQAGVGFKRQILLVVARQLIQGDLLAGQQPSRGFRHGGLGGREVDAVQRQLGFQLLDLRGPFTSTLPEASAAPPRLCRRPLSR